MAWRYFKVTSGGSSSTEFNPKEFNILAGTTQCQVGGSIESDRAPMWSTLATVIDGSLTTATYWPAGFNPTVIITMPAAHTDLTKIEIHHTFSHLKHSVWLSQDKVEWIPCTWIENIGNTQNFGIPALPTSSQNFVAHADHSDLDINHDEFMEYVQGEEIGGQVFQAVPINWIEVSGVTITEGTLRKTSGNGWNAGAQSSQQTNGHQRFIIEFIPPTTAERIAFGLEEVGDVEEHGNKDIDFVWEINPDGLTEININEVNVHRGTYVVGDVFQVEVDTYNIYFWQNDLIIHMIEGHGDWPLAADCSIYYEGDTFTPTLYMEVQSGPQNFEQFGQLNIGMSEDAAKEYTANGYSYSRWTLNFLDYYQWADQDYTPHGYAYEQTAIEPIGLTQDAAQDYTAKGYERFGTDAQEIIFDFGAVQAYTPQGYNFEQSTQENIFVSYIGAQAFTAEGYDRATMAQENILLVSIAAQVYTAHGYHSEATTGQALTALTQEAAQEFAAHFEQAAQDSVNLVMQAAQIFAAHFESQAQLNFGLDFAASQNYTAIGYTNEMSTSEALDLTIGAAQEFAARFEQSITETVTLLMVASADYQANFTATANQSIFVSDASEQTYIRSDGLQFGTNAQDNINITFGAAQEFIAFGGYSFNQNASNAITLNAAASLLYELGETGKFSQRAALYLNLQESTQKEYTQNWLDFESNAAETMALSFGATSDHVEAHIFEANAAEDLTYYISPLQFYGKYFEGTDQENIGLSINATSVYTNVFNEYEATTLEGFYLHHTDKAIHEINYLSFTQNMYYDFYFWHYADSLHAVGSKDFTGQATETTGLTIAASMQYTNANMLNGFAAENINVNMAAHVDHIKATIYEFNNVATQDIHLDLLATCSHTIATIYEFTHLANESIGLSFGAVSEHVEAHIFDHEINENITLFYYGFSEYQNINPFSSKANDLLMFEHWATFEVTTEPRDYVMDEQLNFKLKIVNWVYFESDIYKPTYKLEVEKPNTLWEPIEEDRPDPYIFGRNPHNEIDRRILSLTDIGEPKKISYEKPNTLYTHKLELERGLMDD